MLPGTYREDDADGVKLDTLVEARIEILSAKAQLQDINVMLDGLADDNEGIWTDDERTQLRQMQRDAQKLAEVCQENASDVTEELEQLKD